MPQAAEQPPQEQPPPVSNLNQAIKPANVMGRFRSYVGSKVNDYAATQPSISGRLKHVVFALLIGTGIFLVFNSQIILGQIGYLTNSGAGENTPVITEASTNTPVGPEPRIIIPKINVNVPVVYDVKSFNEQKVQQALERGVVHYGTTAVPGQSGNNVIVGHSSNNWWASGKYKFAFVLLDKLETGDTFVLHYKSQRYVYEVFKKFVTAPDDLSVIQPTKEPVTTLITCTPPGTSWKRLIVQAKQISPEPDTSPAQEGDLPVETIESPLPGNPPSFWDKVRNWLFGTN